MGGLVYRNYDFLRFQSRCIKLLIFELQESYAFSKTKLFSTFIFSFLFPDKFKFTPYIVLSMGCLLSGIYLYETKKKADVQSKEQSKK